MAYWMRRQPGAFRVFRGRAGEPQGFGACLDPCAEDLGVDPGVDSMWQYTRRHGAARPGEHVRAWRFFLDRDRGQASSPSLTLFAVCQVLDILTRDGSAWTLVGAYADAGLRGPTLGYLDFWLSSRGGVHDRGCHLPGLRPRPAAHRPRVVRAHRGPRGGCPGPAGGGADG
ncbi:hypothetical protein ACQ4WX_03265 [Streptomyces lasalocidi]